MWSLIGKALQSVLKFVGTITGSPEISLSWRMKWTGYNKMANFKYFSPKEIEGLQGNLPAMLDMARGIAGVPFIITSGLRTQEQNDALPEAVRDSSHLMGYAVDLACSDSETRFAILKGLFAAGFTRIGIYKDGHIHADISPTLPPKVVWLN